MSVTSGRTDPTQVICSGEGLEFGYINQPIEALINIQNAGPGKDFYITVTISTLQRDDVSNQQRLDCLLNCLFRRR